MPDDRTPVIVGVAQLEQRVEDPREGKEPLELMVDAALAAGEDAGSRELIRAADSVRVPRGAWGYGDPARVVAERIGAASAQTVLTPFGGNYVQRLVNLTCLAIQSGELEVAVVAGAECGNSRDKAKRAGYRLPWSEAPGRPDLYIDGDRSMNHEAELARKIAMPIQIYPLIESALRYDRKESIEAHGQRIAELWAGFNSVAVANPHAWIREPLSAEEIGTPSPSNRMVGFPYPKLMNSNSRVDQAASLLICSLGAARRHGIDESRFVFPHAGTDVHDHMMFSWRDRLHVSPGIRLAGARALELAGVEVGDVAHFDLYSCFPSAVQVAARELDIPEGRALTVTGGLTFGGGPLNNYVMHGIARMAEVLREDPGARGLCTANGGYLTKHAFGVYSTEPPAAGFQHADLQEEIDPLPRREAVVDHRGEATLEAYTVMHDEDGPQIAHAAFLLADGRRTWANSEDPDLALAMTREEFCGRVARVDGAGAFTV